MSTPVFAMEHIREGHHLNLFLEVCFENMLVTRFRNFSEVSKQIHPYTSARAPRQAETKNAAAAAAAAAVMPEQCFSDVVVTFSLSFVDLSAISRRCSGDVLVLFVSFKIIPLSM